MCFLISTIFFLFPCYLNSIWKPYATDNPSIRSDKGKALETSKQIVFQCLTAFSISEFTLTILELIFSYSRWYRTVPYRIDLNLHCTHSPPWWEFWTKVKIWETPSILDFYCLIALIMVLQWNPVKTTTAPRAGPFDWNPYKVNVFNHSIHLL